MARRLKRELGLFGAVMLGLGSIVGTGVFVSIGVAAGVTGPSVVLAVLAGALVASFNGLSSAQLAANHPVSGGTYEYGYQFLRPVLGFLAGWLFLIAKSASAATAALGFGGYLLALLGVPGASLRIPLALAAILALTLVVRAGIRRSSLTNLVIVSLTLLSLLLFVTLGFTPALRAAPTTLAGLWPSSGGVGAFLQATALMFVAYTGYGRIATLGEEVIEPRRTIPQAILLTLGFTMLLYGSVSFVAVGALGAPALAEGTAGRAAPLALAAGTFGRPWLAAAVSLGAVFAMLGVLLNLILGLSRVLLAMGRRRDMPRVFSRVGKNGEAPGAAVLAVGGLVALLALSGDVKTTWSFSAFTVLGYYALTNLAALFVPEAGRLYPRWLSLAGLACCLGLAFFVEPPIWLAGLGLVLLGLLWFTVAQRLKRG